MFKEKTIKSKFNLFCAAVCFYLNEFIYITLLKEKDTAYLHSHERFRQDFFPFHKQFAHKLAQAIYDYVIETSACEITHSFQECDKTIEYFLGSKIYFTYENDYSHIRNNINRLYLPSYFEIAEYLFGLKDSWATYFGGKNWYKAITLCQNFGKVPDTEFVDQMIDLQHNTGTLFNKDTNIFSKLSGKLFQDFLNKKRIIVDEESLFSYLLCQYTGLKIYDFNEIYWRFITLYGPNSWSLEDYKKDLLINCKILGQRKVYSLMSYKPIEYTNEFRYYNFVMSCDMEDEYDALNEGCI